MDTQNQNDAIKLSLPAQKTITVQPAQTSTLTEVTLGRIIDIPSERVVRAFVREVNAPFILWEGDAYEQIGDYTQSQINARILELIAGM